MIAQRKDAHTQGLIDRVTAVLASDGDWLAEFGRFGHNADPPRGEGLVDYLFAVGDQPHEPDDVFRHLRWGGVRGFPLLPR